MKDFLGHGSNGKGSNSALTRKDGPASALPHVTGRPSGGKGFGAPSGGGVPMSSNAQAAQSLMSTLRATQAPIHPAMVGQRSPDGGSAS